MSEQPPQQQHHHATDVKPTSLRHLIGQTGVKAQVTVALEAAWADHRRFDHGMLTGSPGLGKSALATVIAAEMATELHEVLGQSIKRPADLNALLLSASDRDLIHIDEAHELDKRMQTALYLALDKRVLLTGSDTGRKPQSVRLADFTLLLSTTDEYKLLQPLRDRMRLNLRFEFYSQAELAEVVRQQVQALRWEVGFGVAERIAVSARGTPRIALSLLQSARRVARSSGQSAVTPMHLVKAFALEGLDALGLNVTEQRHLRLLANGPTRLNVLASALGLPTRTVADVTESYLIRANLIAKNKDGLRELTSEGRAHLLEADDSQAT